MKRLSFVTAGMLALGGCAAVLIPPDRLEHSEATMRGAEELGAAKIPEAKLHLQFARDQTDQAKRLAAAGDERALLVLSRADADAELALGLAKQDAAHVEAVKAIEDLKAVQLRPAP